MPPEITECAALEMKLIIQGCKLDSCPWATGCRTIPREGPSAPGDDNRCWWPVYDLQLAAATRRSVGPTGGCRFVAGDLSWIAEAGHRGRKPLVFHLCSAAYQSIYILCCRMLIFNKIIQTRAHWWLIILNCVHHTIPQKSLRTCYVDIHLKIALFG